MGTWIEISHLTYLLHTQYVVPSWARGLKLLKQQNLWLGLLVVPSWARGLKSQARGNDVAVGTCRALMGTWIEICESDVRDCHRRVVPSWARGLKFVAVYVQ